MPEINPENIERRIRILWKVHLAKHPRVVKKLIPKELQGYIEILLEFTENLWPSINFDFVNKVNFSKEEYHKRLQRIDSALTKMEEIYVAEHRTHQKI